MLKINYFLVDCAKKILKCGNEVQYYQSLRNKRLSIKPVY